MKIIRIFIFLCVITSFTLACSKNSKTSESEYALPTASEKTDALKGLSTTLSTYYSYGDVTTNLYTPPTPLVKTQIVVLALHDGPTSTLQTDAFSPLHEFFQVLYVKTSFQITSETDGLDSRLINNREKITQNKARKAIIKSAAIIHKLVEHFQSQERIVYVVANSFGSFLFSYAMMSFGTQVDKVILSAGRLNLEDSFVNYLKQGKSSCFDYSDNKINVVREGTHSSCTNIENNPRAIESYNINVLKSFVKNPNYMQTLSSINLNGVLYISSSEDKSVGTMTASEKKFLQRKGAKVIVVSGGHESAKNIFKFHTDADATEGEKSVMFFFNQPLDKGISLSPLSSNTAMNIYPATGLATMSANKDEVYDIGIVFEGKDVNDESMRWRMNSFLGNGRYSLFKTPVFSRHKAKFRVYYGKAASPNPAPVNSISATDEQKKFIHYSFQFLSTLELVTREELSIEQESAFSMLSSLQPFFYADIFSIKVYKDSVEGRAETDELRSDHDLAETHYERMDAVFDANEDKEFALQIYITPGNSNGYASSSWYKVFTPFMETSFFLGGYSLGDDAFAKTAVHEFGHVFGNINDEYYAYSLSTPATPADLNPKTAFSRFSNNCFRYFPDPEAPAPGASAEVGRPENKPQELTLNKIAAVDPDTQSVQIILRDEVSRILGIAFTPDNFKVNIVNNPWLKEEGVFQSIDFQRTDLILGDRIDGYMGDLFEGCNSSTSFRATRNSIMNSYISISEPEWKSSAAWGPVNSYYLNKNLKALTGIAANENHIFFSKRYWKTTEDVGTLNLNLKRTGDLSTAVNVVVSTDWVGFNETALAGTDYTALIDQSVTFAVGSNTATLPIAIEDDAEENEIREDFAVVIKTYPENYKPGVNTHAIVEIIDND